MTVFKSRALIAALSMLSLGAGAEQAFVIEDLPKLQNAGNLTVSPDGETVAYTLSVPRDVVAGDEDGSADSHLYVIRGDSEPQLFIGGKTSISAVSFSEDGEHVYFKSKRAGDKQSALYRIALSGGEASKVFEFETSIGDYALSADGNTLYFVAQSKEEKKDLSDKGFKAYVFEEDQRLANIWSVSLSQADAQAEAIFSKGHVSDIELSPNGKFIVAAVAPTNLIDDYYMKRDLHVIDLVSMDITNTIDLPGKLGSFEISPNNDYIAMHAGTDINDSSSGVLMLASTDSPELKQLTKDALQHVVDLDWLGKDILTVVHRGVETALVTYEIDGDIKRTYKTADDIAIRSADVGDGEIRFIADSPAHPREVFEIRRNASSKLSEHNAWLNQRRLAEQSTFSYRARDGEQIEGLLITPNGDKPTKGWPLILMVHGGPEAHYSDGWLTAYSIPGQYAAAQGYAVFYPNYRGSTGRGVAFAKAHQNDYAGKEFNDLVDGVKALTEASIVDKDRVGITGGSYGGYASMWGATALSEHFKAAVAFVGISNQVSKFGTSDIPNEMYHVHSLKWPWDDNHWMQLIERSPIYHAGKANTPILIMHGAEDTRVHPAQSMELYRSIKVRTETPVRLVFYPGEGHGNRKAAAQYDYALRLMRWMNTYLDEAATRDTAMPPFDLNMSERLQTTED